MQDKTICLLTLSMMKIWNYQIIHASSIVLFHQFLSTIFIYFRWKFKCHRLLQGLLLFLLKQFFLQRIKNGWNRVVNNFLMVSLNHLLTITIKKNHDKIQWVFWIISAEEQIYTLSCNGTQSTKKQSKGSKPLKYMFTC